MNEHIGYWDCIYALMAYTIIGRVASIIALKLNVKKF
jgi:hypothetical protein